METNQRNQYIAAVHTCDKCTFQMQEANEITMFTVDCHGIEWVSQLPRQVGCHHKSHQL